MTMLRSFVTSVLLLAALEKVGRVSSFSFQNCNTKIKTKTSGINSVNNNGRDILPTSQLLSSPSSLNFDMSKLDTQLYSSPWETAATYNRQNNKGTTGATAGATKSNNDNYKNGNNNKNNNSKDKYKYQQRDPTTELNRTKFLLNQARGNLQESEMRATAAEHRVALLQNELKAVNGKIGAAGGTNGGTNGSSNAAGETSKEREQLKKEVQSLNESIKKLRLKMKTQINKIQTNFDNEKKQLLTKQYKLQNDLNIAQSELLASLEEVSTLKSTTKELTIEVTRIIHQSEQDQQQLKLSHASNIVSLQKEAKEIQNFLQMDKSNLEQSLQTQQQKNEELREEYNRMSRQAAADMTLVKKQHVEETSALQKEILFHRMEVDDRNRQIEELHNERSKVRTLAGIQFNLVKSRIKNRYKKIFKRGSTSTAKQRKIEVKNNKRM
mmetsp:Transcript_2518/g.3588  ORF Transcript_2518/g.3588 Transcript_2518/m.3588 type:complete len:439 (-) Transcript_2518:163-1479(-)